VTLSFRTESEAAAELQDAAAWYEEQRPGLGRELLDAVDDALVFIARWPHAGTAVPDVPPEVLVRRVPVRRFPYHVVYLEMADTIQDPGVFARRAIAWILAYESWLVARRIIH
jgi:toxin ParE1/3/4